MSTFPSRRIVAILVAVAMAVPVFSPVTASAAWPADAPRLAIPAQRAAGADRYASAVLMAKRAYPGWTGVSHVVIASGEDRAASDPLAASGLCWAYDAPLLLTKSGALPASTKTALAEITAVNTTVTVHVVGGTKVVPAARIAEIKSIVGPRVEQPWKSGGRYVLAAGIADRVRKVASDTSRTVPAAAFVVNGADPRRFGDALAASAISRYTGIPVLLTADKIAPSATVGALQRAGSPETIIIGGTSAVGSAVYKQLGADGRWSGSTRYATAAAIARKAVARGWAKGQTVGLATRIPDALAGASSLGRDGGVVLLTESVRLHKTPWTFLLNPPAQVTGIVVLGGTKSVSAAQLAEVQGSPGLPFVGTSTPARYVGKTMRVAGRVNANATTVTLYVGGVNKGSRAVVPYGSFDFGWITSPSKKSTVEVRASNPDGKTCSARCTVERLTFPYATCIVIDKSEFKLYWVKDNRLVKIYPVAIGRPGMETPVATWKILAKYHTDPGGVYGPRKMRLFRKVGSSFVFTAYNLHGTNQPWVIPSKASHGCIRMYNRDVLELYPQVPMGTMVITRP